mgnify:CR=1 FL=1
MKKVILHLGENKNINYHNLKMEKMYLYFLIGNLDENSGECY